MMSRPRLIALLLALATLLVFLPAGRYHFVNFDDPDYVTDNPFVKNGLSWTDLRWAFTAFHSGNWHPLTWISHQADCELFGLNAGAHHFVNLLFHAANVALAFLFLWRLTERLWPAALIAALFGWHPLHVESVAWISERKDVLSTFFALLSLLSYVVYARENRRNCFWLALVFLALGLLAKPMLVTLPCVFLLLDFWPLARFERGKDETPVAAETVSFKAVAGCVGEKWPFFGLAAISCVITFFAQKNGGAVVTLTHVPLSYRIENAPIAAVKYVLKLFWPADLSPMYLLERIYWWQALLSCTVLISISAVAWCRRNRQPYLIVGWLWFLGMLVPVIGLIQVGSQAMADRYTYLPSIGFFLAVGLLASDGLARLQTPKVIVAGISGLTLAGCISATELQLPIWQDSETLFRHALELNPRNDFALINLGVTLQEEGRLDEALAAYQQAEQLEDGPYYQLHDNYGDLLDKLGRHGQALAEYGKAIQKNPRDAFAHNAAGTEFALMGRPESAFREFAAAEQLDPHDAWPHVETAQLLLKTGHDAEAVNELRTAVRIDPDNPHVLAVTAHILAANAHSAARDGRTSLLLAGKANDLTGHTQPMIFDVMGMACAELGDFTNAQACAQMALSLAAALQMTNTAPLQERLERYQHHEPWRESFLATNGPVKD
jgi:tetratricopeptide (TPR) repeat protein